MDQTQVLELEGVVSAARDSLTDEMVGRIAETVAAGFSLLDRLNRGGAFRIVQALERLEASGSLERLASSLPLALERLDTVTGLLESLEAASRETAAAPPSTGGIGNMWKLLTDSDTQQTLRFLLSVGRHMRSRGSKV